MEQNRQEIDADTMKAYELRTGFKGLGEFLVSIGVVTLVGGEE